MDDRIQRPTTVGFNGQDPQLCVYHIPRSKFAWTEISPKLMARGSHGRGEVKKAAAVVAPLHYGFRATSESMDTNVTLHLKLTARSAFVYKVFSTTSNAPSFAHPHTIGPR